MITALEDYDVSIEIEYIHREDLARELNIEEETEKQLSIDDISSANKNTPETDEDIEEIQGNATIYISLLKLKLDDMYRQCGIPDEEYNKMKSWLDHIAISILDMKATISLITDLSSKMNEKLGN